MSLSRISLTIPADLLRRLDRKARELDRSRSWVIGEAVRRFLEAPSPAVVREAAAPYTATPGLGESRRRQLEADLALTPTQRVRAAQQAGGAARSRRRVAGPLRLLSFDRYEDYLAWKNGEGRLS